jgi:hypothetical protein
MYAVAVETHDPSRESTPLYLVTFETSRPMGARNTSYKHLLRRPRNPGRKGTPTYLVTLKTRDPGGQKTLHVRSYCRNTAIRADKAHLFP